MTDPEYLSNQFKQDARAFVLMTDENFALALEDLKVALTTIGLRIQLYEVHQCQQHLTTSK